MIGQKQILGRKPKLWPVNAYKYYVIHFLEKPFENIDDYVCIPFTWIKLRRAKDRKVIVSYPSKNLFGTNADSVILYKETREDDWKRYLAEVIHGTDSYDDAQSYIIEKFNSKTNGGQPLNIDKRLIIKDHDKVKSKNEKTKRLNKSNNDENIITGTAKTERKDPIKLKIKRTVSDTYVGSAKKGSRVTFVSEVPQKSSRPFKASHENQIFPAKRDNSIQNSCFTISNGNKPETVTQYIPSPENSCKNSRDQLNSEVLLFVQDMYTSLYSLCKRLEEIMQAANNSCDSSSETSKSSLRSTTEDEINDESSDVEYEQNDDYYDSDHVTDTENFLEKKRHHIHKKMIFHGSFVQRVEQMVPEANKPRGRSCKASSSSITNAFEEEEDNDAAMVEDDAAVIKQEDAAEEKDYLFEEGDDASEKENNAADEDYATDLKDDKAKGGDVATEFEDDAAKEECAAVEVEDDRAVVDIAAKEVDDIAEVEGDDANVERGGGGDEDTKDDNDGSLDSDQDNDNEVPVKKPQMRRFILPPEYDANDSKWTLKHRAPAPGLVELIENSKVYVDAKNLNNCKRMSKDCKTLARKLLFEVFNKSALSTCSVTGARARGYETEMQRPGLDAHARNVLLAFVKMYGAEKGWSAPTRLLFNAIRNKMQRMRVTYR